MTDKDRRDLAVQEMDRQITEIDANLTIAAKREAAQLAEVHAEFDAGVFDRELLGWRALDATADIVLERSKLESQKAVLTEIRNADDPFLKKLIDFGS